MTRSATSGAAAVRPSGAPRTEVGRLASLLVGRRTLVLSGAGISTESGIPDYRSPRQLERRHKPMMYREFVDSEAARRRYWARSAVGWQAVSAAAPNEGHKALAVLERHGAVSGVITQNVDGLHLKAGSEEVVELHGVLSRVVCLACRCVVARDVLQEQMLAANPTFKSSAQITPDGDAALPDDLIEGFVVPDCEGCGGVLKPDVVFFGENVPREWAVHAFRMLEEAEALLVVGSSLTVMSGLRFVLEASRKGMPIAIVNDGPTRADADAHLKVEARLGEALPELARELVSREGARRTSA